ncbi:hypothetical protein GCM10012284_65190 [Mangrovihabitans endophyticus]|uniref:Uncharacterized protein n=2 Tax=Mangrovihabitans endophyticus TaxID=1751298 RepID=A0A8J3FS58_9ACTN|nr:hypothetical protein GCM10012284_65190 [Mangrovihabitans endophyticus]
MRRRPNAPIFLALLLSIVVIMIAAGLLSGIADLPTGAALGVASVLVVILLPLLFMFAPRGFFGRSDKFR